MARASSGIGGLIPIALVGVGGYFLYDWWSKRPATTPTPAGSGTGTTTPSFNSLDAIAARTMAAGGSGSLLTADGWNFYLQRELPAGKVAPDPNDFIGGAPRTNTMTFSQYWGAVAPKLKSDLGLSGLGIFGGLAGLGRRR